MRSLRDWRILWNLGVTSTLGGLLGCSVGLNVPETAEIECAVTADCPDGWQCDELTSQCRSIDRPPPRCGDGIVDPDEACDCGDDPGDFSSACRGPNSDSAPDRCRTGCVDPTCGDLGLDSGEECDDGNGVSGDGCSGLCVREICGNGVLDEGEECDDGGNNPGGGCNPVCALEVCGNGIVDFPGEQCDCGDPDTMPPDWCGDFNNGDPDGSCTLECATRFCGNGELNEGEHCDAGPYAPEQDCSPDCMSDETCQNDYIDFQVGEICDDGNNVAGDGCSPDCLSREACGNDYLDSATGEQCDDGNLNQGDGCGPTCLFEVCGNGFVDVSAGEDCDDGNAVSHDGCSSGCTAESLHWTEPPEALRARSGVRMVFDSVRGRVVLFGGSSYFQSESDTWEFDGTVWREVHPQNHPPARLYHGMAYDPVRERTVVFGGLGDDGYFKDTWEYDGSNWTEIATATVPDHRGGHVMFYDPINAGVLMTGGASGFDDPLKPTWIFNGTDWTIKTSAFPETYNRIYAGATWDEANGRGIMFGGAIKGWANTNTTLAWNGTSWTVLTTTATPSQRRFAEVVFDASRGTVLMHSGSHGSTRYEHVMELNGSNWTEVLPSGGPGYRSGHATCFADFGEWSATLSFGGGSVDGLEGDLWKLEAGAWGKIPTSVALAPDTYFEPPARSAHNAVWDSKRNLVVLYLGRELDHTWEFDGAVWRNITTATTPPTDLSSRERQYCSMAYDPVAERTVMFGGGHQNAPGNYADTWEYDGTDWALRSASGGPSARISHVMAFDENLQKVVLFGGYRNVSYFNDMYAWDSTAGSWSPIPKTGPWPAARAHATMTSDTARQRLVLFGGQVRFSGTPRTRFYTGDIWEFDGSEWTDRTPKDNAPRPAARAYARMTYDTHRQRVILVGGNTNGAGAKDVWQWDDGDWGFLRYAELPEGQSLSAAAVAYFPPLRAVVHHKTNVWFLEYSSDWPDEQCSGGTDEDSDLLTDCADPDCEGLPCGDGTRCLAGSCQ